MTVKKSEKDKQIAKLLRKVKNLESKNKKQAEELKASKKTIKKQDQKEKKNKKKNGR